MVALFYCVYWDPVFPVMAAGVSSRRCGYLLFPQLKTRKFLGWGWFLLLLSEATLHVVIQSPESGSTSIWPGSARRHFPWSQEPLSGSLMKWHPPLRRVQMGRRTGRPPAAQRAWPLPLSIAFWWSSWFISAGLWWSSTRFTWPGTWASASAGPCSACSCSPGGRRTGSGRTVGSDVLLIWWRMRGMLSPPSWRPPYRWLHGYVQYVCVEESYSQPKSSLEMLISRKLKLFWQGATFQTCHNLKNDDYPFHLCSKLTAMCCHQVFWTQTSETSSGLHECFLVLLFAWRSRMSTDCRSVVLQEDFASAHLTAPLPDTQWLM